MRLDVTQSDRHQLAALIQRLEDGGRLTDFTDLLQEAVDSLEDHDANEAALFLIGAIQALDEPDTALPLEMVEEGDRR